jgi:TolA-binding protein
MMKRARTALTALAVTLGLAVPALAQDEAPRYRRTTPKVKVDVKQTERTKKLSERALKTKKEDKKPTLTSEEFLNVQGKVGNIRKSQQSKLFRLAQVTPDDNAEKPEILFRLAESFAQEQRYYRFRAFEAYGKAEAAKNRAERSKLKRQQKAFFAEEKKALTQAIKVYAALANNPKFKNYKKMDEVLFYYAYTLQNAKRIPLSRTVFKLLIQNYPQSRFVPFAYLAFADYYFEQNQLDTADQFYGKVLEFPKSSVYNLALYKRGWVFLNQDRNQDALETFYKVAQRTKGKKQYDVLNRAAKKDFVRAYAEVGKAQRAHAAFQRVDRGYAFTMLKVLALLYFDQGKAAKAIYTFRELMRLKPRHKEICDWQYNIQQSMLSAGDKTQVVEETAKLARLYTVARDKKILKGAALGECRENAQLVTSELAKLWHIEANKTLNPETLGYAEGLYEAYVQYFPEAKDIGMMQYYYAELLWSRAEKTENPRVATERWEKAALAFTDVVKAGKLNAKFKKEAAYAAVLGWKNALRIDPRTKVAPPPDDLDSEKKIPEPKPIDGREKKMIDAFDIYINYIKNPKDEELVMMKFLKARIYWRHDHLEDALPIFQDIVDQHPDHETALYSAHIILDSLIRLQKYDELNKWAIKISTNQKFLEDKDDLRERVADIKAKSMRKAAEMLEKDKKWVECGEAYLAIFETSPNSPGMDEVLYNAGVCFEEGKSIGFAIRMFGELRKKFPKSKLSERALVRMGNAYGAISRYEDSAKLYEEYANKYAGEKDASAALSNAVTYRKGIGHDRQAIKNIEEFVKKFKNKRRDDAADAFFGMTGIYEKQGNDAMVVKHLQRYLREFGSRGGRDRVIIANAKIGEVLWNQSCRGKGVDGACVKIARERALRRTRRQRRKGAAVPNRCGESDRIVLTVIERDKSKARQAQGYFKKAIREWGRGADSIPDERKPGAAYWAYAAYFYLAEDQYESFLDIKFPEKLNFDPNKPKVVAQSKKRFEDWFKKKSAVGAKVNGMYKEILDGKSAAWAIAAAARMGQVSQNAADGLYRAEVPAIARTGPYAEDLYFAYCGVLEDFAKPLEQTSIAAFTFCLDETTKRNWFNTWAKLCERELGQINPQDFPAALEVHGKPDEVASVTDMSGLIPEIKQ